MKTSFILNFIQQNQSWSWIILGIAFLAFEVLAPGSFMIWLGLAALVVGLLNFVFEISWQLQGISFAVLAVIFLLLGRRFFAKKQGDTDQPFLNQRGKALVGQTVILSEPIIGGKGRTKIADSLWQIEGPDLAEGQRAVIVDTRSSILLVKAAKD